LLLFFGSTQSYTIIQMHGKKRKAILRHALLDSMLSFHFHLVCTHTQLYTLSTMHVITMWWAQVRLLWLSLLFIQCTMCSVAHLLFFVNVKIYGILLYAEQKLIFVYHYLCIFLQLPL